ncbi:archaeosortase family protein ArtF [Thermococcus waiotapuensis]|uniref:Archaeosortase family protein ArtF n=1 Tax=Thermococcus waiotapuensis TaxID=90909 RepID=A0AAE4NV97_9EURY|nr:archaeosortase family protein ArtF [Thermococcus waiotapuensis]MDV3103961.1 archaeosortase family protein ArtF [Thermococcus waiotapuensis]
MKLPKIPELAVFIGSLIVSTVVVMVLGVKYGGPLIKVEAANIHSLLSMVGIENALAGNMIYLPGERMTFEITWECSGMFSILLYTVVYFAIPKLRRHLWEYLIGVSVIYLLNLGRIFLAIYAYHTFGEGAFSLLHYTIGPLLMFTVVVLLLASAFVKSLRPN